MRSHSSLIVSHESFGCSELPEFACILHSHQRWIPSSQQFPSRFLKTSQQLKICSPCSFPRRLKEFFIPGLHTLLGSSALFWIHRGPVCFKDSSACGLKLKQSWVSFFISECTCHWISLSLRVPSSVFLLFFPYFMFCAFYCLCFLVILHARARTHTHKCRLSSFLVGTCK